MKLYVIYDSVVKKFMNPFLMNNDEEAKRAFTQAVNSNQNTTVVINYRDMQLFCLGNYDENSGVITSHVYHVINGTQVKEEPKPFTTIDFPTNPIEGE